MKSFKEIQAELLSLAERPESAPEITEEMKEHAKVLVELLDRQDVLALIFRCGNEQGTPNLEIDLAEGKRDDQPEMKFEEEVVLQISLASNRMYFSSLVGRIIINSKRLKGNRPAFRMEDELSCWMEQKYLGSYEPGEVLSLSSGGRLFEIEMVRTLDTESLVASHGTRLEEIFETLAGVVGVDL